MKRTLENGTQITVNPIATETFRDCGDEVVICTHRRWSRRTVQQACIDNDLYTCGTNDDYMNMLDMADRMYPDTKKLYFIAKDICKHSADQTITNVMFILEREAVITTYEINGSDEI